MQLYDNGTIYNTGAGRMVADTAVVIHSGNEQEFLTHKSEPSYDTEFKQWSIDKEDGAFYYQNERLRIFMDFRTDHSSVYSGYDRQGTVDLQLIRDKNGDICKLEHLTKIESDAILSDSDIAISSGVILPENTKEIAVSFDINNGGVKILPAISNEIKASYDSEYYDVDIVNINGSWNKRISGKVSMMGKTGDVQLYDPDVMCTMDVNVSNGNFSYALPEDCADEISITAQNAGIGFITGRMTAQT